MAPQRWTTAMRQAWPFITRAVGEGLTATGGLEQYRAGGGEIRTADWYTEFRSAFGLFGKRETIEAIPSTYTIPEVMGEYVDIDYKRRYAVVATARYYNPETGRWEEKTVTGESDDLLTKRDWMAEMERRMEIWPESPPFDVERGVTFSDWELRIRAYTGP